MKYLKLIIQTLEKNKSIVATMILLLFFYLMFTDGLEILSNSNVNAVRSFRSNFGDILRSDEKSWHHFSTSYLLRGTLNSLIGGIGLLLTSKNLLRVLRR